MITNIKLKRNNYELWMVYFEEEIIYDFEHHSAHYHSMQQ